MAGSNNKLIRPPPETSLQQEIAMTDIAEARSKIDAIDTAILELLQKRNSAVVSIAENKYRNGIPVKNQERESLHLQELLAKAEAMGISPALTAQLFTAIFTDSRSRQMSLIHGLDASKGGTLEKIRVSYLGTRGSYSYHATHKFYHPVESRLVERGCATFQEIISSVENDEADCGILPIENTSSGCINEVYDLLQNARVHITGELTYNINHGVLAAAPTALSRIKTVYSHAQPIQQCSQWLHKNLPEAIFKTTSATTEAMEIVAGLKSPEAVAIGCEDSAPLYGLTPLFSNIANQKVNITRFIVIGKEEITVPVTITAKTSLTFTTQNRPGALVRVLEVFSKRNINIVKLESRPRIGNREGLIWAETFYADVIANTETAVLQDALRQLRDVTGDVKILGCYPATAIPDEA